MSFDKYILLKQINSFLTLMNGFAIYHSIMAKLIHYHYKESEDFTKNMQEALPIALDYVNILIEGLENLL